MDLEIPSLGLGSEEAVVHVTTMKSYVLCQGWNDLLLLNWPRNYEPRTGFPNGFPWLSFFHHAWHDGILFVNPCCLVYPCIHNFDRGVGMQ